MSRIISRVATNYEAKNTAFPYQHEAFMTLKDMEYSAIFHEQGLGKTKIAIDLLLYWLQKRDLDTVMIVTKKQLVKNWQDEFVVHTHIRPKILTNNKAENYFVLNSPAKVIITNFETLSTDKKRIELFLKCRNVGIIIDESTKLKNPDAKLTQDFFELAPLFKIRNIMTGTPVANRPYDIWAQIFFLDMGESLGSDFSEFKKSTDLRNDFEVNNGALLDFQESVGAIYSKIAHFSVRETKKTCGIELPQKVYKTIFAAPEEKQIKIYDQIIKELEVEISQEGETIIDDDSAALKRLLRLNQVASNPRLIDDEYEGPSGKEVELDKLLTEIVSRGEKCIVWSNFIDNVEFFCKKYSEYCPKMIHGSLSMEQRNASVSSFKTDERCKVLFATPQAAKEGLTLTVANHVIFYDRGFNLDDYLQAQDRIHRISQKRTCYVYNLMLEDSIDVWIDSLLQAKQYAAFLAQGDISIEEYKSVADYSYGELIKEILASKEE
ncbi:MAG: DEAD/DEAH box helicase [Lachnospiraceae bacterium]|nr:DEAD/DEAH box helicase [Lachnospiraceae bacterium]